MISANNIIGSLVYRTREALNKNERFLKALQGYAFVDNCVVGNRLNLWHYPGTMNEISDILLNLSKHRNGYLLKFPSVLNFQNIKQERGGETILHYNLAIVAPVLSEWLTEERESQTFDLLLRPIYDEFLHQITISGYFNLDYGTPPHTCYEVFTTGDSTGVMLERYGDNIDAIELHDLRLELKPSLCHRDNINRESKLVLKGIEKILI